MDNLVYIPRHTPEKVKLHYKGEYIQTLYSDIELGLAQLEIAKLDSPDYHIEWNGQKISINKDGELEKWPKGMYDMTQKIYGEIWNVRRAKLGSEQNGKL